MKHPIIHPYRSKHDLVLLKDWFYNFQTTDNRFKAVQRVKALLSRGKLPHTIEITSLITLVILLDTDITDTNILKLSYSMAIIRFVNGLLDSFQQSTHAIPLYQLAKSLNLPSFFVELRHMSTHESLPTLPICRIAAKRALNWLWENYWHHINDEEKTVEEVGGGEIGSGRIVGLGETDGFTVSSSEVSQNGLRKGALRGLRTSNSDSVADSNKNSIFKPTSAQVQLIIPDLKIYKKIRKSNLDLIYKFGDDSNKQYWKAIKNLKKNNINNSLIHCLIYNNFLIYNDDRPNTKFNDKLLKLYSPLLDEFGVNFKIDLMFNILDTVDQYTLPTSNASHFEIIQLINWLSYLIVNILIESNLRNQLLNDFLSYLRPIIDDLPIESKWFKILEEVTKLQSNLSTSFSEKSLKNKINNDNKTLLESWTKDLKNSLDLKKSYVSKSLDEILGQSSMTTPNTDSTITDSNTQEPAKKKQKVSRNYIFEEIPNWKPTPFGTVFAGEVN